MTADAMAGTRRRWWKSLSPRRRHKIADIVHGWDARRARRIEAGLPLSSPEENSNDEDRTMEEASDEELAPASAPVAGFTMAQAQAHFDRVMAEVEQEEQAAPPVSAFRMLQEEQRYNLQLLADHRLAEEHIAGEQANEHAVAALVEEDPAFVDEQRALYASVQSARTIRRERWQLRVNEAERNRLFADIEAEADAEAAQAVADGNAANIGSSASFAPGRNGDEVGPSGSILDLTSTGDVDSQAADSEEE